MIRITQSTLHLTTICGSTVLALVVAGMLMRRGKLPDRANLTVGSSARHHTSFPPCYPPDSTELSSPVSIITSSPAGTAIPQQGDPIPELDAAEADYADAQKALDEKFFAFQRQTSGATPEDRRDRLIAWTKETEPARQVQIVRSQVIQKLYDRYNVPTNPDALERLMAAAPKGEEEAGSARGRLWALECATARIRARFADNPEELRDAFIAWDVANGQKVKDLVAEINEETTSAHQEASAPGSAGPGNNLSAEAPLGEPVTSVDGSRPEMPE